MLRHAFAWFFLIYFALIGAAGEGLHLLPGCAHYIEFGGRTLGLGIPASPDEGSRSEGEPTLDSHQPPAAALLYPGDCPICSLLAQCRAALQLSCTMPHRQAAVFFTAPTGPLAVRPVVRAFDARGPPSV